MPFHKLEMREGSVGMSPSAPVGELLDALRKSSCFSPWMTRFCLPAMDVRSVGAQMTGRV
jgi:hypothetical protein